MSFIKRGKTYNSMKSIIIIGKGNSLHRCTKELVDSFDEVAICNRPPYEGFESIISDHADYDFITSEKTALKYSNELWEKLNIKETILTGLNSEIRDKFSFKTLDPSTGTLAFYYFLLKPEYTHICLAGFDLMVKGSKEYYFNLNQMNPQLLYLIGQEVYDNELTRLTDSGHNTEMTHEFMVKSFNENPNRKFTLITDYPFETLENITIL